MSAQAVPGSHCNSEVIAEAAVRNLPFCTDPGHMGAKEAAEDTVANTSAAEQEVWITG